MEEGKDTMGGIREKIRKRGERLGKWGKRDKRGHGKERGGKRGKRRKM
jgi:hypothetical protein